MKYWKKIKSWICVKKIESWFTGESAQVCDGEMSCRFNNLYLCRDMLINCEVVEFNVTVQGQSSIWNYGENDFPSLHLGD